jgi:replicative DNA helicase
VGGCGGPAAAGIEPSTAKGREAEAMSVTELAHSMPSEFERTPPQDITAEQCVLGGMMLSKDAIADVVETLRGTDFYKPAHQLVYDAVLDLYGRGEPADAVTVSAELTKRGEIGRMGGAPYLHTLLASVPTAANAGYYARIVRDRAVLRRLVQAGTRITQMGYGADGEVDAIVDAAEAEVFAVSDKRSSEDYLPLSEIMEGALDEIESIGSRNGAMVGVPTGFFDLDQLTNGFHPGQMIIVAARPAIGKALALDTPLPTPTGWTTMGTVAVGEELLGADGRPTRVVAATEEMRGRPCYEVAFSDGSVIVADGQHQWLTDLRTARAWTPNGRSPTSARARSQRPGGAVRTTVEIAASLRVEGPGRRTEHAVLNTLPLDLPVREFPIPPYALGVRLGVHRYAAAHAPAAAPVAASVGATVGGSVGGSGRPDDATAAEPRRPAGRIPRALLRASIAQRRALLAGLLDADGKVMPNGAVHFATTSAGLAEDVHELVVGLGYGASVTPRRVDAATPGSTVYTVAFRPTEEVFRGERKRVLQRRRGVRGLRRPPTRTIVAVRRVPSVPVRCVQVDNRDHLFLAGRTMIPTHNSTLALDFARSASIKSGQTSVIFSLEMSRNEITMRLLSAEARVALHSMRSGTMSDDDWTRLARRMGEVSSAPLFIDDSPNMTMMEIRSKARRLKQRNNLRMIVIDYLQLMSSGKKVESRQQEVSEFSRSLKLLAKELEVPVIALSQLNRGPEMRTDKKPMLSDLRESGCVTADTTLLRADTGAPITLRRLLDVGYDGVLVWSFDERRNLVSAPLTNVFPSGIKPVFRLRLASGRQVKATGNHPFLTFHGWTALDTLEVGSRVAVPRLVPEPIGAGLGWSEHRLGLLAQLLGGGRVLPGRPVDYTSADEANLDFVDAAAAAEFGIDARRGRQGNRQHTYLSSPSRSTHGERNPLHVWFRELGIDDLRSHEKRIPDQVHQGSNSEVATFLRHLWATDGTVVVPPPGAKSTAEVGYGTTSRNLADGVMILLARFGIIARIKPTHPVGDERPLYHVVVADGPGVRAFCTKIGVHGTRAEDVERLAALLADRPTNSDVDALPGEAWDLVESERCAEALDSGLLRDAATDDVFWDRVVAIEPLGEMPVYDATVKGTHNFIADGIAAHNSLEQDADMVILLHREDAYEKESPRAGEADLIVAKHRNGPTATVTVAFQGHYSRFVDMANN